MILKKFAQAVNISYTQKIMDTLSNFGDDPASGNRSAGSRSSTLAAEYLYNLFKDIGLSNVTMDDYLINGWTFKGASLKYTDCSGKKEKITLGGYATNFKADNHKYRMVYGGKGTLQELEAAGDIKDKLVLICPLNPLTDYWVSFPAYQAYLKGAAGILVSAVHDIEIPDSLISNDVTVPAYCKVLSINIGAADKLKSIITNSKDKEITVTLNSDSTVVPYQTSYNVWGEIKGKTDEVIYLMAHYDGYYHSYFDDACGVSEIVGIAKALIDSGYKPEKTIRIIAHGAEEWGKGYNAVDWAAGSFEEIMNIHPEWAEDGFAVINIDGGFALPNERNFFIYTSPELSNFVKEVTPQVLCHCPDYKFEIIYPDITFVDDFIYQKAGIPGITSGESFKSALYYRAYYHSSFDSKKIGLNKRTYKLVQLLYGSIVLSLDKIPLRPMNFSTRFNLLKESLDSNLISEKFKSLVEDLCLYGDKLDKKIQELNCSYKNSEYNALKVNKKLYKIYKTIQDNLLALTYEIAVTFPHYLPQKNLQLLSDAICAMKNRSKTLEYIVDNYLMKIDLNNCVFDYDKITYDFFSYRYSYGSAETFAYKMFLYPNEDLYDVCHMLAAKYKDPHPDVNKELTVLENAYNNQLNYFKNAAADEYKSCVCILKQIKILLDKI